MPHSIFFTSRGHAIHGSNDTRRLGRPASHGCIRLAPAKAAILFALVKAEGPGNTKVVITGDELNRTARQSSRSRTTQRATEPRQVSGRVPRDPFWETGWSYRQTRPDQGGYATYDDEAPTPSRSRWR